MGILIPNRRRAGVVAESPASPMPDLQTVPRAKPPSFIGSLPLPFFRLRSRPVPDLDGTIANLPMVKGDWPEPEPGQLLILVGCSSDYLARHGFSLACSLDRNSPGTHLHVHIVNPDSSSDQTLGILGRELHGTTLSWTEESFDFTDLPREFARAYYASIRFVRLLQLLSARQTDILMLDIDVIVRDSLEDLRNFSDGYDCAIHTRFHKRKKREKLFASAFYVTQSPASMAYLENATSYIADAIAQRRARWFVDQIALFKAYRSLTASGATLRLRHLPERYADWNFHKSSAIWAGKGKRKEENEAYLSQRAAYTPKVKRLADATSAIPGARPRVAIILPQLDLPFKNPGGLRGLPDRLRRRSFQDMRLRVHWRSFADAMKSAFEREGFEAAVISHPLWQVTTDFIESLGADIVFIPHKHRFQFGELQCRTYFYMQSTIPSLFTVDPLGWGAGSSAYPCDYRSGDPSHGTFEHTVDRIVRRNGSKFQQPPRAGRRDLAEKGEIPDGPYIFFACQRPNDDSIRFFSPHEAVNVVGNVCRWARRRGLSVVFKGHPTNAGSAKPLRKAATGSDVYWSTASIHDLIAYSDAVYVINSGVGLEAILHGKPVVTFGQTEYDAVSISGDLDDLDRVWQQVRDSDPDRRLDRYRRFVDWYCRLYCVDLSNPRARDARLRALVLEMTSDFKSPIPTENLH